ncbi:hexose transporter [Colletotrichum karsti]|uniref:Hexose transporter n=1 Tax=Colletotrichum karsti TaxID=1095194 RepID=A0A9P6I9G3_9PEZI|nr:hexose transporter [Colletotrichum karsti]KAF9878424.1 hexose transporter [Colletotrichum karsti]
MAKDTLSATEPVGIPVTVEAAIENNRGALKWLSNSGIVKLNCVLVLSLVSSYATGYDGSMMNGLQSLDTWQESFNHPDAQQLGLLNAIQNVGQLVALPFCAWFCDHFGRKPALLTSASILLIGVALQGAAQNVGMFIAARGVLGFGLALNITAAPLMIMELAYPSQRAPLVSIYNSLWGLGALSAAWITFGTFRIGNTWAWRIPSILQGVSSIVQLGLCFFIEESPRWLISKERYAEAEALIIKYHANGDASDLVVPLEMEEIRTALQLEAEASRSTSYMSFFQTPGNRRRFFIILAVGFFSQWSGNGLISYYLSLILNSIGYTSQDTQTLINALMTLWGLIWGLIASFLVNRFRRRTMFLFSTLGSLACYVTWTALQATYEQQTDLTGSGSPALAKGVLAMIFLFNVVFNFGWGALQVTYVVEILPFNLRAKGLVLYNLFVAMALIFNQYANPVGVTNSKWKYYITYNVWLAFEAVVVYFLFVETGKMSLEETAAILDGNQDRLTEEVARKTEKTVLEIHENAVEDKARG